MSRRASRPPVPALRPLKSGLMTFQSDGGPVRAYLSMPEEGRFPGVLVCHAWWGLTSYFRKLADRLAREGFVALAPDLYDGRTGFSIPDAERLVEKLDPKEGIRKTDAALDYLLTLPSVAGDKVGAIGFSMGGGFAARLSALRPEVAAVVLFYGGGEQSPDFAGLTHAALQGHFAEADEWEPEESVRDLEVRMRDAGKEADFYFYPGAGHWFFEDNRPMDYKAEAAGLAWRRTLDFLHSKLG